MAQKRKSSIAGTVGLIAVIGSLFWGVPAFANAATETTEKVYNNCTVLFTAEEKGVESVITDTCGEFVITDEFYQKHVYEGKKYDFRTEGKKINPFGEPATITMALIY